MKELMNHAEEKMSKTVAALEKEYGAVRAGRANPAILDRVTVDYYGTATPINQMAAVSVPEARMLQIQPWDVSTLKDIEKAILASDIGITPLNDGKVIRINFPPLTEERRKELCKQVEKHGEEAKVNIRNHRRDANDFFKKQLKDKLITEDEQKDIEKDVQKLTDDFVAKIGKMVEEKKNEIMDI